MRQRGTDAVEGASAPLEPNGVADAAEHEYFPRIPALFGMLITAPWLAVGRCIDTVVRAEEL
jgi:hypothetical protein